MAVASKVVQKRNNQRRTAARRFLEPGTSPGSLRPLPDSPPPSISLLSSEDGSLCQVKVIEDLQTLPKPAVNGIHWVRVTGLGEVEPLINIATFYGLRSLALEDALDGAWRTMMEMEGDFVYFVLQGAPDIEDHYKSDRLTLFCKPGLILTFEDKPAQVVDHLWQRLQEEPIKGLSRHLAEFLTYMVLDLLVDAFFPHLDNLDKTLTRLEEMLTEHLPTRAELNELYMVKRDLITLRRLITPFKEMRNELVKVHTKESLDDLKPFYSDLSDHVTEAYEMIDTYHELAQTLDNTCQSMITNRVNEVVRILTIISTIFMPLSFIAGIYGMNFEVMPELKWRYGYQACLAIMALVAIGMVIFFKKKKWT